MAKLYELIPEEALGFVKVSGNELLEMIGHDELREIVAGVLCGENIRAATEPLTRRRIAALNAAVLLTVARASAVMSSEEMVDNAHHEYRSLKSSDPRKTVLMWLLGLTHKQVQNVLRSNDTAWKDFVRLVKQASADSSAQSRKTFGDIDWVFQVESLTTSWNWIWAHSFMTAIGTVTLATRGAEKSMYGKFFEKLILGSVLDVLGFSFDNSGSGKAGTFWLSERGEKRESDATAIISEGEGVRFDIGFIGPGNTEISLDKVSRFIRVDEIAGKRFDMATIIIVDRIGKGSRIQEQAAEIGGTILQMSSSLWAKDLDAKLDDCFDSYSRVFESTATAKDIRDAVFQRLSDADFNVLLENVGNE